ncbi:MAG: hypothetical protein KC731_03025 [Myxococcales bacterium]|nr:hypothetical protein [Myxococcales bacterium]
MSAEDESLDEAPAAATNVTEWLEGAPLSRRHHLFFGLGLPSILAIIHMWQVRAHTVDDAFISYRYAENFAKGLGLVYNAGERIEGYTNFLWTVLLGVAIKLGLDPVGAAKILGALCALGTLALAYRLGEDLRPYGRMPCVSTWLLASSIVFLGYAVFGLETGLFTLLVTGGAYLFLREERSPAPPSAPWSRRLPWSGLVFAAAGLTRPEAPMYLGLLMLFMGGPVLIPLLHKPDEDIDDPDARRVATLFFALLFATSTFGIRVFAVGTPVQVPWALAVLGGLLGLLAVLSLPRGLFSPRNLVRGALFVVPVGAHLLWRHQYYGRWLPRTLTAKTGDLAQQLAGGGDYAKHFVEHEGPLPYLLLFAMGAALAWRHREMLALAAIAVTGAAYVILVGGDWMVLFRFFVPLVPFFYILLDVVLRAAVDEGRRALHYGLALLALFVVTQRGRQIRDDSGLALNKEKVFWDGAAGGVARWFRDQEAARGHEAVAGTLALGDIGQVGYETGYPILDLLGLVDPVISDLPGGYTRKVGPGFRDRFFDVGPRYVIIISSDGDCRHPSVLGSRVLYQDARFRKSYVESGRVAIPPDGRFNWCIYERRELANPGAAPEG